MTYEEIIQALRYCKFGVPCEKCPVVGNEDCCDEVNTAAADLIERLTAENVALREGASLGKVKRPQKIAYEKSIEFLRALTDGQSDEIKSLRRELEWKDMVIALAQRKQAEAEAERDALLGELRKSGCTYCKYATMCVDELSVFGQEDCDRCGNRESCVCLTCSGYGSETDKWQWRGLPEAPEEGEKA